MTASFDRICALCCAVAGVAVLAPAAAAQGHCGACWVGPAGWGTLLMWSGQTEPGGPPGFDEPLASDRPDFTEASTTVGRGVVQLEMGYTLFDNDDGGTRTRSGAA